MIVLINAFTFGLALPAEQHEFFLPIKLILKFILQVFIMNVFDFHGLSEKQQLDTLEETGVFIAERQRPFYNIKLYQLEGFYVELYYHTHFNVIVNVNCFSNTDCLDPYLQSINLDALIDA